MTIMSLLVGKFDVFRDGQFRKLEQNEKCTLKILAALLN